MAATPLHLTRARASTSAVLSATLLVATLLLLLGSPAARADQPTGATGATGATGSVTQLGADPTVHVARHRHCVRTKAVFWPDYTGGGGIEVSYLYVNGRRVAKRHSAGAIRISARRLRRGLNRFELISEFADGRAASVTGSLRRCRGH